MVALDEIRRRLAEHRPTLLGDDGKRRAAVAMVLRGPAEAPEVLFIERARRRGDPWSGHMAFPGGRIEARDASPREAAERETLEEVGLRLDVAEPLGQLDDLQGHHAATTPRMVISAFVYHLAVPDGLALNHEVQEAFWFPLASLHEPERHVEYPLPRRLAGPYPGLLVGEPDRHIVWGLTYRFLEVFFAVVGRPLPHRWEPAR